MAGSAKQIRRITFKTGRVLRRTRGAVSKAFDTVTREMTQVVRRKIGKSYPPSSRPGAHPHLRTGFLQRNFEVTRKGFNLFVRVPQYGIFLEGGTGKMRARPFIRRNLFTRDKQLFWTRKINTQIRKNLAGKK